MSGWVRKWIDGYISVVCISLILIVFVLFAHVNQPRLESSAQEASAIAKVGGTGGLVCGVWLSIDRRNKIKTIQNKK